MNRMRSLLLLLLLAGAGVAVSYFAQQLARPKITAEQRASQARQLLDVLPAHSYDNQPLDQPLPIHDPALDHSTLLGGYLATRNGQPSAVLLRSQVSGYAGPIELLIAIGADGRLLGSKSLKQGETPGLGGHIADQPNAWLQGFAGRSRNDLPDNAWALKKDQGQFDQMAGATITSRAVVNALHDALRYFDEHRAQWLGPTANE